MAFNPEKHFIKIANRDKTGNVTYRDYLTVAWRIAWLRDVNPNWCILTEPLFFDDKMARFKATVLDETGNVIANAHGSESITDFKDYFEKAETKAVGRAVAYAGFGTAYAAELDEGPRVVDAPLETPVAKPATKAAKASTAAPVAKPANIPETTPAAANANVASDTKAQAEPQAAKETGAADDAADKLANALAFIPFKTGNNAGKPMAELDRSSLDWIIRAEKTSVKMKEAAWLVLNHRFELKGAQAAEPEKDEPLAEEPPDEYMKGVKFPADNKAAVA